MSKSILDTIMGQLDGDKLKQLGQQAGTDETQARDGLSAAIPLILGALQGNATDKGGAESLQKSLKRDHDGSILDNIGDFLGDPKKANGAGILKHVLGDRRGTIENKLAERNGMESGSMGSLLEMAAPLVMGALGRQQGSGGFDVGMLEQFLGGERKASEKDSGIMGMVTDLLDSDKDGSIIDDIGGLAGKFFGKK